MGYIPSADTIYAVAYLTETGRNYLFNETNGRFDANGDDLFEITKFTLSDADTNYQTTLILSSGEVPDVTGKSEGCLKTTANYVQTNLLAFVFDDTPTNVSYSTDLPPTEFGDPSFLIIDENDVPPSTETTIFTAPGGGTNFPSSPGAQGTGS